MRSTRRIKYRNIISFLFLISVNQCRSVVKSLSEFLFECKVSRQEEDFTTDLH